jgi:hypothetical protein
MPGDSRSGVEIEVRSVPAFAHWPPVSAPLSLGTYGRSRHRVIWWLFQLKDGLIRYILRKSHMQFAIQEIKE